MQLDIASRNIQETTKQRNTATNTKGGNVGTNTGEYDKQIQYQQTIYKRLQEKNEHDTSLNLLCNILLQSNIVNQKELDTVLNNDYIKKLVFYICSVMPLYKGTQELLLNGNMFDVFNVVVDYFHLN